MVSFAFSDDLRRTAGLYGAVALLTATRRVEKFGEAGQEIDVGPDATDTRATTLAR